MEQIYKRIENVIDSMGMSPEERLKFIKEITEYRKNLKSSTLIELIQNHFKQQLIQHKSPLRKN